MCAAPALAAKPAAPIAEAESIAETAARRYKSGDFELAAQLYDRAYELAKRPALLFNAARAWDRAGRVREALQRYEACAAVETDAGAREEARLRATRLREQFASPQPAPPVPTAPAPVATVPAAAPEPARPGPTPLAAPPTTAPGGAPARLPMVTVTGPTRSAPLRGPWILVGVGGAIALGGGIALGLTGADDNVLRTDTDRRDGNGWVTGTTQRSAFERADAVGRRKTWSAAVTGVGGALALAGMVWWAASGDEPAKPAVGLWPAPDGLAVVGWF